MLRASRVAAFPSRGAGVEFHYDLDFIPARFKNCTELWALDRCSYVVCGAACWGVSASNGDG